MQIKNKKTTRVLTSICLVLLTFPSFYLVSAPGLDSSYGWGLNHLFAYDFERLTELVYPIGVFGFLKMPLPIGLNLVLAYLVISILKFFTIYLLLSLNNLKTLTSRIGSVIAVAMISGFSGYDITFVLLSSLLALKYLERNKISFLFTLTAVTYLGFNIKTSIGISCFSVVFFTLFISFLRTKNWRKFLKDSVISFATIFFFGLLIFGSFLSTWQHFIHAFKISSGYSSSLAIHPANNWWALGSFILLVLTFPLFFKKRKLSSFFWILLPTFFMMWKHAMVREDTSHNGILFYFTVVFFGVAYLLETHSKWRVIFYGFLTSFFFFINFSTIDGYNGIAMKFDGLTNFKQMVLNKDFIQSQKIVTDSNLKILELPEEIRAIIGNKTIDFYPWEHNYAQANKLNWSPRKSIEIGASSSHWVSKLASEHYQGKDAPEYILWHFYPDNYEGNMGSFDQRLLINDEPLVISTILRNYESVALTKRFKLFKKKQVPNILIQTSETTNEANFGDWIAVPKTKSFVRSKIVLEHSFFRQLGTFLYKDDLYEIDYKLSDDRIFTYRFVPNTAVDGIWISPFVNEISSQYFSGNTEFFRIRKVFYSAYNQGFQYQFIHNSLKSDSININPFNKSGVQKSNILLAEFIDFEKRENSIWFEKSNQGFESNSANLIEKEKYSFTYRITLDSVWKNTESEFLTIQVQAKTNFEGEIADLVIERKNSQNDFWIPIPVKSRKDWQHIYTQKTIRRTDSDTSQILIYFWNKDTEKLLIDDFEVKIIAVTP